MQLMKRIPNGPPQLLRIVEDADEDVQAYLLSQENIKKTIQRSGLKDFPSTQVHIKDLQEIPDTLQKISACNNFLLYDSENNEDCDLEHRIIIFRTCQNLKLIFFGHLVL